MHVTLEASWFIAREPETIWFKEPFLRIIEVVAKQILIRSQENIGEDNLPAAAEDLVSAFDCNPARLKKLLRPAVSKEVSHSLLL